MNTEQLHRIEHVVKNPDCVAETPDEIADRNQLRRLFQNSNPSYPRWVDDYEAGWKAAKAYYESQQ